MMNITAIIGRFLSYVIEQFKVKRCQQSAAALTYMTLFAIVPLMTVTFSMFSVIPAFQGLETQLQSVIFEHFVPDTGQEVEQYLSEFSSQARGLSGAGVLMLVVTAYLMLKNIERTFNTIWGVVEARKGLPNFLLYWAVLSLGPLLLGLGLGMSTYLISLKLMVNEYDSLGVVPWFLQFTPWLLTSAAFTLLFAAVPNCKVSIKHAVIGGVITAVCFEVLKGLFGAIVSQASFSAIYGAFAFVPLFLMWIYSLWMIVLAGAVLVCSLSTSKAAVSGITYPDLVAALLILWQFEQRRAKGGAVSESRQFLVGVEAEQWQRIRDALLHHNVIAKTQQDDFVLCRDLRWVTLGDLANMLQMHSRMPGISDYLRQFAWFPAAAQRLLSVDQYTDKQFDVTVGELFASEHESEASGLDESRRLKLPHQELMGQVLSRGDTKPEDTQPGKLVESAGGNTSGATLNTDSVQPNSGVDKEEKEALGSHYEKFMRDRLRDALKRSSKRD